MVKILSIVAFIWVLLVSTVVVLSTESEMKLFVRGLIVVFFLGMLLVFLLAYMYVKNKTSIGTLIRPDEQGALPHVVTTEKVFNPLTGKREKRQVWFNPNSVGLEHWRGRAVSANDLYLAALNRVTSGNHGSVPASLVKEPDQLIGQVNDNIKSLPLPGAVVTQPGQSIMIDAIAETIL